MEEYKTGDGSTRQGTVLCPGRECSWFPWVCGINRTFITQKTQNRPLSRSPVHQWELCKGVHKLQICADANTVLLEQTVEI